MFDTYQQLGYATNDFDRAVALIREAQSLGPFLETRDLTIGARGTATVTGHFAQAFKADIQFEIIEPLEGDTSFYGEALRHDGFAMQLHHIGRYFADREAFEAEQARLARLWPKVVECSMFDGTYCYFDAREPLGHYLELFTFPPAAHFKGVPVY